MTEVGNMEQESVLEIRQPAQPMSAKRKLANIEMERQQLLEDLAELDRRRDFFMKDRLGEAYIKMQDQIASAQFSDDTAEEISCLLDRLKEVDPLFRETAQKVMTSGRDPMHPFNMADEVDKHVARQQEDPVSDRSEPDRFQDDRDPSFR